MADEIWKPCFRHEDVYVVSNLGRVASIKPNGDLSQRKLEHLDKQGYQSLVLKGRVKSHRYRVCVLVALAFHNAKPGWKIKHIDGNVLNNVSDNLSCAPQIEGVRKNDFIESLVKADQLDHEILLKKILYVPATGRFYRRPRIKHCGYLSSSNGQKFIQVHLLGMKYAAHRLAFFYMNGRWPEGGIRHIDRNKLNNAFSNLKELYFKRTR